jgi:DNA-binding NarL/FixJ family response regulator
MNTSITILLADDHTLTRRTLGTWLAEQPDMAVVGGVSDGEQAVLESVKHQPDVVVLDIDMVGMHSFEAAHTIQAQCVATKIVILSAYSHDRFIEQALSAKASAYITKSEPPEVVASAIRTVASGGTYFSPDVQRRLIVDVRGVRLINEAQTRVGKLTPREIETLRLLALGKSKRDVAKSMDLSERTVNCHCASLMAKLDIHDRVGLCRYAIREGLVEP